MDIARIFAEAQLEFPYLKLKVEEWLKRPSEGITKGPRIDYLIYGEDDYPLRLTHCEDPPLVISVMGEKDILQETSLAVVGSRNPTHETQRWLREELGEFCENNKLVILSGGARGVDQEAHAVALRKKRPTILTLPSGLSELYPGNLKNWVSLVLDSGGAFISEYPVNQVMRRFHFQHRNRLIAQLGIATLVVQASERSGTLMTGHLAAEFGRPLWVVPGHPLHQEYKGNLKLLQEGACLVTDANDLSLFFRLENASFVSADVYVGG